MVDDHDYLARNNIEVVGTSGDVVDVADVDWGDSSAIEGLRFRQRPGEMWSRFLILASCSSSADLPISLLNEPSTRRS